MVGIAGSSCSHRASVSHSTVAPAPSSCNRSYTKSDSHADDACKRTRRLCSERRSVLGRTNALHTHTRYAPSTAHAGTSGGGIYDAMITKEPRCGASGDVRKEYSP